MFSYSRVIMNDLLNKKKWPNILFKSYLVRISFYFRSILTAHKISLHGPWLLHVMLTCAFLEQSNAQTNRKSCSQLQTVKTNSWWWSWWNRAGPPQKTRAKWIPHSETAACDDNYLWLKTIVVEYISLHMIKRIQLLKAAYFSINYGNDHNQGTLNVVPGSRGYVNIRLHVSWHNSANTRVCIE